MSSCVREALADVLDTLKEIPFDWSAAGYTDKSLPDKLLQKVLMYNAKSQRLEEDPGYLTEFPAVFLEATLSSSTQFTNNVALRDVVWRVHLYDQMLNTVDEINMDQNLFATNLRDQIAQALVGYTPPNCSTMYLHMEEPDYSHSSLYQYVLEFKTVLTDTKGSALDPDQTKVIYKAPPTALELSLGFTEGGEPPVDPLVAYIWKACRVRVQIVDVPDPLITQELDNGAVIPLQYALRPDGGLYVPYLMSAPGINVLSTFIINNQLADSVEWRWLTGEDINVFYNNNGGFAVGDEIEFDASLPIL